MAALISRAFTAVLTSPSRRAASRTVLAWRRRVAGRPAVVRYFHDPADPYSHLAAQMLAALRARYNIVCTPYLVPAPDAGAAPDAGRLASWSLRDAAILAGAYGLAFPAQAVLPDEAALSRFRRVLAALLARDDFGPRAAEAGALFWRGAQVPGELASEAETEAALQQGAALRARLGHYLGATFHFEGEWYWGVGRLHFLEERLRAAGLDRVPDAPNLAPIREISLGGPAGSARGHVLHFFLSFRSPYTYIAVARARALATHYGCELRLRFVLPMVMRGLPVPVAKRIYITLDTKREAERLGLPFGVIADPVGVGVERGLAVLHHAIPAGKGEAFCQSFLQGAFAEGVDAASEAGLGLMAARAGIGAAEVAAALADTSWREVAERNRQELLASGLWGVPCFRVDEGEVFWGQDRLWKVEEGLLF
jgi:2-hydroxychromene-2-carboxylate isomerase